MGPPYAYSLSTEYVQKIARSGVGMGVPPPLSAWCAIALYLAGRSVTYSSTCAIVPRLSVIAPVGTVPSMLRGNACMIG